MNYSLSALLYWESIYPIDLYGKMDNADTVYSGNVGGSDLTWALSSVPLGTPTFPFGGYGCFSSSNRTPEWVSGDFTSAHNFQFWYNQFSTCKIDSPEINKQVKILNTGTDNLIIKITNFGESTPFQTNVVNPGQLFSSNNIYYAGYGNGDVSSNGGTLYSIDTTSSSTTSTTSSPTTPTSTTSTTPQIIILPTTIKTTTPHFPTKFTLPTSSNPQSVNPPVFNSPIPIDPLSYELTTTAIPQITTSTTSTTSTTQTTTIKFTTRQNPCPGDGSCNKLSF